LKSFINASKNFGGGVKYKVLDCDGGCDNMVKIDREKIVKAAVGSARLEGYKGPLKPLKEKGADVKRAEAKTEPTAKR
jgi:hypothetical protein